MNLQAAHLTPTQLEEYLQGILGNSPRDHQRIVKHLSECGSCLDLALQAQRAQLGFLDRDPTSRSPHPDCPDEDTLRRLAAGDFAEAGSKLIHHIVQCSFCGPRLQQFRDDFFPSPHHAKTARAGDPSLAFTREDADFLSRLKTSRDSWRKEFVRRHVPVRKKDSFFAWVQRHVSLEKRRWIVAAAGAAVAIILAPLAVIEGPAIADKLKRDKAENLVVQASSERPIEMRIPYARYAPYSKEMGPSSDTKSPALLEVQAMVAKKKRAGHLDRRWQQLDGLASLLEGTPGSAPRASDAFEKAMSGGLDDPSLEIELAASYFEGDGPGDLPKAIDLLEALLKRPRLNPEERKAALFNLAIAYESMRNWERAVAKWDEYLALDSSSEWAREARTKRNDAKPKVPNPKPVDPNPSSFLRTPSLQMHVEEYLDIALRSWLSQAIEHPSSEASAAARKLAGLLAADPHSDPFLKDLIRVTSPGQLNAVKYLADAVKANKTGFYTEAAWKGRLAGSIFREHKNLPGEMRARFEEVFAAQQAVDADDCLLQARSLQKALAVTRYNWLKAQVALEVGTCLNLAGVLAAAQDEVAKSQAIAMKSAFPVMGLRVLGISAGIDRLQNRDEDSWKKAVEGLGLFGEGSYPGERLYQFYSVLEQYAEKKHFLNAQQAFLSQAIAVHETDEPGEESAVVNGSLYGRLSTLYLALKQDALAKDASAESNLQLNRVPNEPYVNVYVVHVKVGLAEAQLRLGHPVMAVSTLQPALPRVPNISHKFIALDFYRILGASYRQLGRFKDSASAYQSGIVLAENALRTLDDESLRLRWITGVDPVYRGLALVLLEQGKDADALKLWEWYQGRPALGMQGVRAASRVSWQDLEKRVFGPLPAAMAETRLVYAALEDRLQIWSVTPVGVKGNGVKIKEADLERKVNEFAAACAIRPDRQGNGNDDVLKPSLELWSLFLGPVIHDQTRDIQSSRSVIIELDPRLSKLPMAALSNPTNGRFFGQEHVITNSPGLVQEAALRKAAPAGLYGEVLLADATPSRGSGRLPGQEELKNTIRSVFPNVNVKTPDQESWAEVSRSLKNSQVFIFIGHGVPEGSGTALVFGRARVKATDFPSDLRHLQLVILEACSTGTAGDHGLQETGTLVHTFLSAGVPVVIASRWDLDSESSARFLSNFFRNLQRGEAASEAMFRARQEAIERDLHPYYWAGLDITGRSDQSTMN